MCSRCRRRQRRVVLIGEPQQLEEPVVQDSYPEGTNGGSRS